MRLLIDYGADAQLRDGMGMKAIDWAEFTGHRQMMPLLKASHNKWKYKYKYNYKYKYIQPKPET